MKMKNYIAEQKLKFVLLAFTLLWGVNAIAQEWNSTSAMLTGETHPGTMQSCQMSASAISESNFDQIWEEQVTSGPRRIKRPDDNPIGDIESESPIGDAILPLLVLVAIGILGKRRTLRRKGE